jgi:hypothetical protein
MGLAYHDLYSVDGQLLNTFDRAYFGTVTVTYAAGGGAGSAVTATVSWTEPVPTPYCAIMSPVEDCTYFISAKTTLGFTLNVLPRLAANTLAGGTVEILIVS